MTEIYIKKIKPIEYNTIRLRKIQHLNFEIINLVVENKQAKITNYLLSNNKHLLKMC